MSTATPSTKPPPEPHLKYRELRVYGHSALFYWWPIWVLGYVMALWTYMNDTRVAILPAGSAYKADQKPHVIELPADDELKNPAEDRSKLPERMHHKKSPGIIFTFALILVILITNVPMRGLASAVVLSIVVIFILFFLYMGWWDNIFDALGRLSIHMNMSFYIFFSSVLLIVWAAVTFGTDRLRYWKVTPGQITYEYVFGGGQRSYDTEGMAFEKLRDDLFRHWVLGLGSGDLIMHPFKTVAGAAEDLSVHNVLFVGKKLQQIQELISLSPRG